MREDIKGKAAVALVVSLIAFGCGTGASIFVGLGLNNIEYPSFSINSSSELPVIYNVKNTTKTNTTTTDTPTVETSTSSSSQDVYEENTNSNPTSQPSTNTTTNVSNTASP